ncbi:T9SS type A sorting domain-containing protein [Flavobacterium nackdongense]|uniref:T9SS type A sorting domain-containing protein n=1 Tax=Flavobacterium nackdongense TaxID=2547394 RepID=A0A4P6Y698_9FLAO|nr:T9SS type A sorting domain-containing protein [Flavobacterium nackdongense]QBN17849.1 T9SS type A sorting domain-containing protein [Flavobacterium nackdongense]
MNRPKPNNSSNNSKSLRFFKAFCVLSILVLSPSSLIAQVGASLPFTIYEAENGALADGASILSQMGIPSAPTVEFESSGRKCVQLNANNESVSWTTTATANAIVVRLCIPDAPNGGGIDATLNLYVDGIFRQTINTTSKYSWIYGNTGGGMEDNDPASGTPKRFYESSRAFISGAAVAAGSVITLKKDSDNSANYYKIDLIALENVGAALSQPANTLSITSYGAIPDDGNDDSTAIKNCIAACQSQGKGMWLPVGEFHSTGIINATGISIYGAGMWYTRNTRTFTTTATRHKWNLTNCNIQDLYIFNPETARLAAEGHDYGMTCQGALGYTIQRVWVNHGGASFWLSGTDALIKDCISTESWADGINLNNSASIQANYAGIRMTAQNNFLIGSGDDGIALNAQNGGGTANNMVDVKILNNTSIGTMWANGMRIAGGRNTILQDNLITDPTSSNGIRIGKFGTTGNPCESVLVSGNTILRGCGLRPLYGQGGICVADGAIATVENNTINDSGAIGIDVQTCTATFTSNSINNPGTYGFLIKSGSTGSGIFTTNTVAKMTIGIVPYQNNASSTFATTLTKNSWQNLSISDLGTTQKSKTIHLYPNPYTNGILSINLIGFEQFDNTTIKIRNLLGQILYEQPLFNTTNNEIDLSGKLPKSIYLIAIESNKSQIIKKLIVN